jgi:hypothetical protein
MDATKSHSAQELAPCFGCTLSLFSVRMIALAGGVGVAFIGALDHGVFAIGLKSGQVRKVSDEHDIVNVVPYISFCTPG